MVFLGPGFHIPLEYSQVLVPGYIGLGEEGQGNVEAGKLGCLEGMAEVRLACSFDDDLPDLLCQGLLGVCCGGQLVADPGFRNSFKGLCDTGVVS